MAMLYDHIDLRVTDLAKARTFYDPLMAAMGFTRIDTDSQNANYHLPSTDRARPFFGLMQEPSHRGNASRTAFRADSREDVDRLAKIAKDAGAQSFEPANYYDADTPWYYATFFEDMDGNKLEICYRGDE